VRTGKREWMLIQLEREVDGRWIAEVPSIPGAIVYGSSPKQAISAVRRLAADVIEDRRRRGEPVGAVDSDPDALKMVVGRHVGEIVPGRTPDTMVGYVDGLPGAHTQAESLDEMFLNLSEVIELVTGNDPAPENLREERLSAREN
jgi:predicted RNase H-like HicB family nuclease